jgi:hypothetical protein
VIYRLLAARHGGADLSCTQPYILYDPDVVAALATPEFEVRAFR